MKLILLILLLSTCILAGHHGSHKCIHDEIHKRIPDREITHIEISEEDERTLQSKPARNLKFTYDMTFFNKLTSSSQDQAFRQIAEKATQIATDYLSNLLTMIPKPSGHMKWDKRTLFCGEAKVPEEDRTIERDSDIHLYVTFTDEPHDNYLAYAGWCRFLRTYGPTHGQVNFNKGLLIQKNLNDPIFYQDFIQTTIHEVIHVLGFSREDIPNWIDSNKKPHKNPVIVSKVRGYDVTFIRTPNILAAAQNYYNCTEVLGMPVENQGGSGSAGSHWETTAILDEMMNPASSPTNSIMSVFTLALLKDTGFYASVNQKMEEPSDYGRNEGCSFLSGECSHQEKEFCNIGATSTCDYYQHGSAKCTETYFTDKGCSTWQAYHNSRCFDMKHYQNTPQHVKQYGISFGHNSKCFQSSLFTSNLRQSNPQPLCYQFECTADKKVVVKVGTQSVVCSKNGEKLNVTGYSGQLNCPDNINQFCGFKKFCPDHCSSNGYCVNGTCLCNKGYSGSNCSVKA